MPIFDKAVYDAMLGMVDGAATANEKGETFENVTQYVLSTLNVVEVMGRDADMPSEEIDLLLWNAQVEEVLRPWDGTILVECKNWTAKVAAPQLDSFISKMRRRSLRTGMLIAANGVTSGYVNGSVAEPNGVVGIIKSAL